MILPMPPDFPVGPWMTEGLQDLLEQSPLLSDEQLDREMGANPDHPFFKMDLLIARLTLSSPSDFPATKPLITMEEMSKLLRQQCGNTMASVCFKTSQMIGEDLTIKEIEAHVKTKKILAEKEIWYGDDVLLDAMRMRRAMDVITNIAGDIPEDVETILRELLMDGGIPGDRKEFVSLVKEVLSKTMAKEIPDTASDGSEASEEIEDGRPT